MRRIVKTFGLGLACTIALGTTNPAHSASVPSLTAAVKNAGTDNVIEVRWRRGWGWGPPLAIAGAVIAGAALAAGPYGYGGYPVYGGDYPVYGGYYPPPYPPPYAVYGAPYGGYYGYYGGRRCVTDDGYGRFRSCDRP
jgi:hypothetical protein